MRLDSLRISRRRPRGSYSRLSNVFRTYHEARRTSLGRSKDVQYRDNGRTDSPYFSY